jgi:translation initiation factor IF-2
MFLNIFKRYIKPQSLNLKPKNELESSELKFPRPPIVTIMGHVDHGKTTLLDSLRNSSVCASEFGGITQGIGAFSLKTKSGEITFIDTPGHLAFTNMRAKGVEVTDIIVLVVCASEGIQPQTLECLDHAKSAEVPIIVAINKIDLPSANLQKVELELLKLGLELDKHGGDVLHVNISAKNKIGLDDLIDTILLQAELMELAEVVDCPARGYVLESRYTPGIGNVCNIINTKGTLKIDDYITAGEAYGKVKKMQDEYGNDLKSLTPSKPAEIIGFKVLPKSGSKYLVTDNQAEAMSMSKTQTSESHKVISQELLTKEEKIVIPSLSFKERRALMNYDTSMLVERLETELEKIKSGELNPEGSRSISQLSKKVDKPIEEQIKNISNLFQSKNEPESIKLILKAQNFGMLEAVEKSIKKLEEAKGIKIYLIKSNVGVIAQEDLDMAQENQAPILCMNVKIDKHIENAAKKANIALKSHKIIYHLLNDVEMLIKDFKETTKEVLLGKALVKDKFEISINKKGKV